jgi:hypothetical protein
MACEYFGPVDLGSADAGETIQKWTASCLASEKKHPKAKVVRTDVLALYCCDKATDQVALEPERREVRLDYDLTLPAPQLTELLEGKEAALPFGTGRLLLRYVHEG